MHAAARAASGPLLDIDAPEQVVERALIDHARDVALDRGLGNPKRPAVEPLVTRSRMQLIPLLGRALCA